MHLFIKHNNPFKIIIYWVGISFLGGIGIGLLSDSNSSGGEQFFLSSLAYSILLMLIGIVILILLIAVFNFSWFKKFWYLMLTILIASLLILMPFLKSMVGSNYDTNEKTIRIGNTQIDIKTEYYSSNPVEIIRSKSFWKNGKKDSIWTTYSKSGQILRQEKYKDDRLIEVLK